MSINRLIHRVIHIVHSGKLKDKNGKTTSIQNVCFVCFFKIIHCQNTELWYNNYNSKYKKKECDRMRYIIYGKNLEVSEGLKQAVHDKFSKLEKFFTPETEVQVTLSVQKDNQTVEATIPMKGTILRVEPTSTDMYVSIDMAVDLLERMIRKYKTKISKYGKGELKFNDEFMEEDVDNHETVTITKSKRFAIKPMDVEEACVQMELLGHSFFVFRNAETFEVNVVYKRKDKTYGLIEPEF